MDKYNLNKRSSAITTRAQRIPYKKYMSFNCIIKKTSLKE